MQAKRNFWISGGLVIVALLLCLLMAEAQSANSSWKGRHATVTGCLRRTSAGYFQLTSRSGKIYQVESREINLTHHVGSQVKMVGSVRRATSAAAQPADAAANSWKDRILRTFRVTRLTTIREGCR